MLFRQSIFRGHHYGDISPTNDLEFHGLVHGSVTVAPGRQLFLRGRIAGDLIVGKDAMAAVHGTITGAVLNRGAHVYISGSAGSVRDTGHRRTYLNHRAVARKTNFIAAQGLGAEPGAGPAAAYGLLLPPAPPSRDPVLDAAHGLKSRAGWTSWITPD